MPQSTISLIGKSGKKFTATLSYGDVYSGLGCHARAIGSISVSVPNASWDMSDDIRANKDNWEVVYKELHRMVGGYSHIVMSDNFAMRGPREELRKRTEGSGYGAGVAAFSQTIWSTSEVMDILAALAEAHGESMTLTPTSGNPAHLSPDAYSACITGVWIKVASPAVVWDKDWKSFWEKAKAALGAKFKGKSDPAGLSYDPEKAAKEVEDLKKKVANIWGD
jgi:hypothetical protein